MRVFYSWQSDSPREQNSSAIRTALRTAANRVEQDTGTVIDLREGPGGTGAPEIANGLTAQIREADVFIADVTIVHRAEGGRGSPNPNVVFEFGLAACELGWSRILLLMNAAGGPPEGLPFDFRHRTAIPFHMRPEHRASDQGALAARISAELMRIVEANPPRPRDMEAGSESAVRRRRDLELTRRYFTSINRSVIDDHLQRGPNQRLERSVRLFDAAHTVREQSAFRLSDQELFALIDQFDDAWERSLAYDEYYRETSSSALLRFGDPRGLSQREREALSELGAAYVDMVAAWRRLLDHIHLNYVELDLDATDRLAINWLNGDDEEDD